MEGILMILAGLLLLAIFFLPSIIAFYREHHYRWVILGINLVFGATGIGFLIAFVWSVWPQQTALVSIVTNDLTTNSAQAGQQIYRQMGQNVRAFDEGRNRISSPPVISNGTKSCPYCGETIKAQAIKCLHCKSSLN